MITYGEAHTEVKLSLKMVDGEWRSGRKQYHKPRMNKQDAGKYYTNKINKAMGWEQKQFTPEPLDTPQTESEISYFDSVDDYYDYHEALRLLSA